MSNPPTKAESSPVAGFETMIFLNPGAAVALTEILKVTDGVPLVV
jgi:hypothetical protein